MKRSIIIGNWKMYANSVADAHILATQIRNHISVIPGVEAVICPPAIWLPEIKAILKKGKVKLGCQDISNEEEGAYTGEISAKMAAEMAEFVIIGHSERREHYGETFFDVNEKAHLALKNGLTPIICIGEKSKNSNLAQPIKELKEALAHIPKAKHDEIIIAYEPIWAISNHGKGESADPDYIVKVIRKLQEEVGFNTPILYGGSVKSANAKSLAERPEIGGALVGAASVRAGEFIKICKIWSESKQISKSVSQ